MDRLADPALPDDDYVKLLEQPFRVFNTSPNPADRNAAQALLTQLQDLPNAWIRVDKVLDYPHSSLQAKFFALQILEKLIKYRWKTLDRATCESIRNYIVSKVIKLSDTDKSLRLEPVLITKLNAILVQIVKQEWPSKWHSFMTEIVGASRSSVSLCENNMTILRMLSQEVFEFSSGQMTHDKITELKRQFNDDFSRVFQLCQYVFDSAPDLQNSRPSLLVATLKTLEKFLYWIPLGYIFETKLIETLVGFMSLPPLRNSALPCLVEIASLSATSVNNVDERFQLLFVSFVKQLVNVLPREIDIARAYDDADDQTQGLVMDLALFFTAFFKNHISVLNVEGPPEMRDALRIAHEYLVNISKVSEVEVFKTALEWWFRLASDLYDNECHIPGTAERGRTLLLGNTGNTQDAQLVMAVGRGNNSSGQLTPKRQFYAPILAAVRQVMIARMAKPEEVLIVEDENGEIVRETTKDTDAIALYKTMRETLVFLTHLDTTNTENIMLQKLAAQIDDSEWSWNNLNTLCWAIGSVSGAMGEEEERKFLVTVVKELLKLCERKRGKDNKAVVASNILYVVGQYPRFLRAHWKFLKTVVNKLFEFMHETHPGVQDMACDTFLKIAQKCRSKFVSLQPGESRPFIVEMLELLPDIIQKLEPHQIQSFYESCGCIIASEHNPVTQQQLIMKLFQLPNSSWQQLVYTASHSEEFLKQRDRMKNFSSILRTNSRVAESLGPPYLVQLQWLFADMLKVYKAYSGLIQLEVVNGGQYATKSSVVRNMRAVKREVLQVLETCISKAHEKDREKIQSAIVDQLTGPVLGDYFSSVPDSREASILSLYSAIVVYMKGTLTTEAITVIFKSLVGVTLEMIRNNFQDFPDARINFFLLLRSINQHNFGSLFALDKNPAAAEAEFRIIINAIVWAFKHTERNVAETGLQILLEMVRNVDKSPFVNYFYRIYFKSILNDILSVLTDTFHRPGFKLQSQILMHLVSAVGSGRITEPIWDQNVPAEMALATNNGAAAAGNGIYLSNHLIKILKEAFPNLTDPQVVDIVKKLLSNPDDKTFKAHLRDFLVQTKEFSKGDNADLFDEEKQMHEMEKLKLEKERLERTPGLIGPNSKA